jgi:hypothetical protein
LLRYTGLPPWGRSVVLRSFSLRYSLDCVEEEFSEVRRFLGALSYLVPWRTYIPLRQEYAAFVTWPADAAWGRRTATCLP